MDKCCRDLLKRVCDLIEARIKLRLDGSERYCEWLAADCEGDEPDEGLVDHVIHIELDELLCEVEKLGKDSA